MNFSIKNEANFLDLTWSNPSIKFSVFYNHLPWQVRPISILLDAYLPEPLKSKQDPRAKFKGKDLGLNSAQLKK